MQVLLRSWEVTDLGGFFEEYSSIEFYRHSVGSNFVQIMQIEDKQGVLLTFGDFRLGLKLHLDFKLQGLRVAEILKTKDGKLTVN